MLLFIITATSMNLKFPDNVKQKFIERKYYRKYFYKLCFKVDDSKITPGIPRIYARFGNTDLFEAQQKLLSEICHYAGDGKDYKLRIEGRHLSVFTNNEQIIEDLVNKVSYRLTEFHSPINTSHREVIDQNRRIRVRKQLFDKKFKFKVYFNQDWKHRDNNYVEVKNWLHNIENTDGLRWGVNEVLQRHFDARAGYKGYTAAVYLNDAEDLMMCQMRFHSEIYIVEEAVLIDSL